MPAPLEQVVKGPPTFWFKSSVGVKLPFSSTTTLRPAWLSSAATGPPPAPDPTTRASQASCRGPPGSFPSYTAGSEGLRPCHSRPSAVEGCTTSGIAGAEQVQADQKNAASLHKAADGLGDWSACHADTPAAAGGPWLLSVGQPLCGRCLPAAACPGALLLPAVADGPAL